MSADPVRDYLEQMECPDHIIEGGLSGLVETWEQIVTEVERGYELGLDDYLNDLDVRQLLHDTLMLATVAQKKDLLARVNAADERLKQVTQQVSYCLWGDEVAAEEGWDAEENWWFYARPRQVSEEFLDELGE